MQISKCRKTHKAIVELCMKQRCWRKKEKKKNWKWRQWAHDARSLECKRTMTTKAEMRESQTTSTNTNRTTKWRGSQRKEKQRDSEQIEMEVDIVTQIEIEINICRESTAMQRPQTIQQNQNSTTLLILAHLFNSVQKHTCWYAICTQITNSCCHSINATLSACRHRCICADGYTIDNRTSAR